MTLIVNIDVDDLERAIEFYTAAFDLRLNRRLFAGSVAELSGEACAIHLIEAPAGSAAVPAPERVRDYGRHWTPVHIDFVVEDVSAAVERAVRARAKLEGQIDVFAWGRLARLSDPFGNGFCLVELTGKGYDAAA